MQHCCSADRAVEVMYDSDRYNVLEILWGSHTRACTHTHKNWLCAVTDRLQQSHVHVHVGFIAPAVVLRIEAYGHLHRTGPQKQVPHRRGISGSGVRRRIEERVQGQRYWGEGG